MTEPTRREYLKVTGATVGVVALATGGLLYVTSRDGEAGASDPTGRGPPDFTARISLPAPDPTVAGAGSGDGAGRRTADADGRGRDAGDAAPNGDGGGGDGPGSGADSGSGSGGGGDGGPADPGTGDPNAPAGDGGDGPGGPGDDPATAPQVRPTSGDRLDYERDAAGNVDFAFGGIRLETTDGDDDVEFAVRTGGVALDFETDDGGESVELALSAGGEFVDLEVDGADVEFDSAGGPFATFEDDGDVDFRGRVVRLEYEVDDRQLDVAGAVDLEFDGDELEFRGVGVTIEWQRGGEFEARLA